MKTGALLFAFDTDHIKYFDIACWSAERIKHWLDLPVAVITNNPRAVDESIFDQVIVHDPDGINYRWFGDIKEHVTWLNRDRPSAYQMSPWDQTLLLDVDYVINSDQLLHIINFPQNFLCFRKAYDISRPEELLCKDFGRYRFPMYWATVMMFRKSPMASYIFDCMNMVKENWQHYRNLYSIGDDSYRNDFALSIALSIVSGHTLQVNEIPWSMASVLPETKLTCDDNEHWSIQYQNSLNQTKMLSFFGMDFHAMGKQDLGVIVETHRRTRLCNHGLELAHS
jgi:hypothetical protein